MWFPYLEKQPHFKEFI